MIRPLIHESILERIGLRINRWRSEIDRAGLGEAKTVASAR